MMIWRRDIRRTAVLIIMTAITQYCSCSCPCIQCFTVQVSQDPATDIENYNFTCQLSSGSIGMLVVNNIILPPQTASDRATLNAKNISCDDILDSCTVNQFWNITVHIPGCCGNNNTIVGCQCYQNQNGSDLCRRNRSLQISGSDGENVTTTTPALLPPTSTTADTVTPVPPTSTAIDIATPTTPTETNVTTTGPSNSNTVVIVVPIAIASTLIMIVVIIICLCRRRRREPTETIIDSEVSPEPAPSPSPACPSPASLPVVCPDLSPDAGSETHTSIPDPNSFCEFKTEM